MLEKLQQRWRRSIQSGKTRLGADCGSNHEPLIAKFRLKAVERLLLNHTKTPGFLGP